MKPPPYTLDPVEFIRSAEAFIADNPKEVNGHPTINLLLFLDIAGGNPHYCWHSTHDTNDTVNLLILWCREGGEPPRPCDRRILSLSRIP
jgi:hypothetical protein